MEARMLYSETSFTLSLVISNNDNAAITADTNTFCLTPVQPISHNVIITVI